MRSMQKYDPKIIEPKWQKVWEEKELYRTTESADKPKYYCLDFFPYPSGSSLSVGHCRNYIPTDVISRFQKMKGFNVLHPMGWDAFGLPAENDAIKKNIHPMDAIPKNVANFKRQLHLIGTSYDWEREINSTDPSYYKWTQWLFLLLYKRGLAYQAVAQQWWCPSCKTVLANEQVEDGKCWRCGSEVTKKGLKQWFFKITAYADRLLFDLDKIDWPEKIKLMQKNWIGRREGINIEYPVLESDQKITCFTTRPDTNFGATFIVLGPEQKNVIEACRKDQIDIVKQYMIRAKKKTEIERISEGRRKTGVFTGSYALNNLTGRKIPIWVSDFVLGNVGTGAVVGVPGHDLRDFEFAQEFGLPIKRVVVGSDGDASEITKPEQVQEDEGTMINSEFLNGLDIHEATKKVMDYLEEKGWGKRVINYKMRDWLISRQRYWGAPIPMVHCEKCGTVPVPEKDLPVLLPRLTDFEPSGSGRSPLSKYPAFVETACPACGGQAQRETDTQDGFACSSWYFLRFVSPHHENFAFEKQATKYWMPVDLYVGGAEHAVMHLLYARFYTKVMYDANLISFDEPFTKLKNQGMILASDGHKMSKSLGNVVTPDETVEKFGADALRMYELFIGPFEQEIAWNEKGIRGTRRFLDKYWNFIFDTDKSAGDSQDREIISLENKTIKKVSEDIEKFKFNTAMSTLMEFLNKILENKNNLSSKVKNDCRKTLTLILAPIAPHITEEVWQKKYGDNSLKWSVHQQNWPAYNDKLIQNEMITLVVQINGKTRGTIEIEKNTEQVRAKKIILADNKFRKYFDKQKIKKIIFVPGKIINFLLLNF